MGPVSAADGASCPAFFGAFRPKLVTVLLCGLFLLTCGVSHASKEIWVFYRSDIPLHRDTVKHLKEISSQSLVFCPVGKTTFSFLESHCPVLAVALGDAALNLALSMSWKLRTLVTLVDETPSDSRIVSLDTQQPYPMQLKLLKTLVPDLDTIWYPYVTERFAPDTSLKRAANDAGLKIVSDRLDDPRVLPGALRILARPRSAAILPPDPGLMNDAIIRSIFLTSFRSKTPVVGFSEALVKQGAAFAYVLSPQNLAAAISELIDKTVFKNNFKQSEKLYDRWNLLLNWTILEKFKLPISDQIKNSASKLF